jgi:hypothetical protein
MTFLQNSIFSSVPTYAVLILLFSIAVFRQKINSRQLFLALSIVFFLVSSLVIQGARDYRETVQGFFEEWGDIIGSPPVTVLATAVGIFLGNTLNRILVTDEKERGETAIVLINALEADARLFFDLVRSLAEESDVSIVRFYLEKLRENKDYEKGIAEIGKFIDNERDTLSRYAMYRWQVLIDIERYLSESEYPSLRFRFESTAIGIHALFCSYLLTYKHCPGQVKEQEGKWLDGFQNFTRWLTSVESSFTVPSSIRRNFIDILMEVRERYRSSIKKVNLPTKEPLYAIYIPINSTKNSEIDLGNEKEAEELLFFGRSIETLRGRMKEVPDAEPIELSPWSLQRSRKVFDLFRGDRAGDKTSDRVSDSPVGS